MKLTTDRIDHVAMLRVDEQRLTFSVLPDFSAAATSLITAGERQIVIDLTAVGYLDSAAIGCLMDLYRQATQVGAAFKLAGVQPRVETMLTMTGAHHFLEVHADRASALASFRS
jgi:anti-anti-sigma factor